tara:strand:- start:669 stop:1262 length:594 start_codon:yes stop_codon:yes gene_type:complete
MCVAALPALGSQVGTLFGASLGINLASNLIGRSAAQQQAAQVAQQSQIAARSAEQSFANQQGALAEQLKETEASKNQERLAATIRGLQARGRIQASERAGLTASLLVRDAERQAANERNSIGQTLDSFRRQYSRNIQGLETQRNNRLNQLQGNINQAYNQVPSLGSVLLNTAASGVTNYLGLLPSPKLDNNVLRFSS